MATFNQLGRYSRSKKDQYLSKGFVSSTKPEADRSTARSASDATIWRPLIRCLCCSCCAIQMSHYLVCCQPLYLTLLPGSHVTFWMSHLSPLKRVSVWTWIRSWPESESCCRLLALSLDLFWSQCSSRSISTRPPIDSTFVAGKESTQMLIQGSSFQAPTHSAVLSIQIQIQNQKLSEIWSNSLK